MIAAVGGLVWWAWEPPNMTERTGIPVYSQAPEGDRERTSLSVAPTSALPRREPRSTEWVVIALVSFFAIGFGVVLWRWLRHLERETSEVPEAGQAVAQALCALEKGGELSDIVLRRYRDMCRILGWKAELRRSGIQVVNWEVSSSLGLSIQSQMGNFTR